MMNKMQRVVNFKIFPYIFWASLFFISFSLHYRIFTLDIIGVHVWRQTLTQSVIDNFVEMDFNILNPHLNDLYYPNGIFRMEFPLAQWICALFIKIFGYNVLVTRIVFYVMSWLSVIGVFQLTQVLFKNKISSYIATWCFAFSPIIYYYSVNPLPDNLALCFSIWSIYFFINYLDSNKLNHFILSCLLLGLATATKLPFILFGAMYLAPFWLTYKTHQKTKIHFLFIPFLFCLPALIWYGFAMQHWTAHGVISGITDSNSSLYALFDILQFNLISTLPELLINYATLPLFIIGLFISTTLLKFNNKTHLSLFLIAVSCSIYFFYEMNIIAKIHDYYLFPFLPIIFILVAKGINYLITSNTNYKLFIFLAILISPITAYLRCNNRWDVTTPGFDIGYTKHKNEIKSIIQPNTKIIIYGDKSSCIVLYQIHAKGWNYCDLALLKKDLLPNIKKGAQFLITHTNSIDNFKQNNKHIDSLIFNKNNIKIYRLK